MSGGGDPKQWTGKHTPGLSFLSKKQREELKLREGKPKVQNGEGKETKEEQPDKK